MKKSPPVAPEWTPESQIRDALLPERLPRALHGKTLFWINLREYLQHDDAHLPPEDYLNHWKAIYQCCLSEDVSDLRRLSYVRVEEPARSEH